jgi:hypothetical protein
LADQTGTGHHDEQEHGDTTLLAAAGVHHQGQGNHVCCDLNRKLKIEREQTLLYAEQKHD